MINETKQTMQELKDIRTRCRIYQGEIKGVLTEDEHEELQCEWQGNMEEEFFSVDELIDEILYGDFNGYQPDLKDKDYFRFKILELYFGSTETLELDVKELFDWVINNPCKVGDKFIETQEAKDKLVSDENRRLLDEIEMEIYDKLREEYFDIKISNINYDLKIMRRKMRKEETTSCDWCGEKIIRGVKGYFSGERGVCNEEEYFKLIEFDRESKEKK